MDLIEEPVQRSDIESYFEEWFGVSLENSTKNDLLYEAVCERIVKMNPKTKIDNLEQIYQDNPEEWESRESLAIEVYENGLSEEVQDMFAITQQNNWIEATVELMEEKSRGNKLY